MRLFIYLELYEYKNDVNIVGNPVKCGIFVYNSSIPQMLYPAAS